MAPHAFTPENAVGQVRGRVGWPAACAVVVAALGLAALLRWLADPLLHEHNPFVLFMIPVLLAAWLGGWKLATAAGILGMLAADFFFVAPRHSLAIASGEHLVGLVFYIGVAGIGIALVELLRAAGHEADAKSRLLQAEVCNHQRTQEELRQAKAQLEQRVIQRTAQLSHANTQRLDEEVARKHAEATSRRLAFLVASSDDAIIGLDLNGIVTDWNTGAERLFGLTAAEITGQTVFSLLPLGDREAGRDNLNKVYQGLQVPPYEARRLRKDGSQVVVSVRLSAIKDGQGTVTGVSLIYRDLTEAKHLEEQLQQAQKMEAVGQLAGGVAHDFNNILTVVNGYSEMLLGGMRPDDPTRFLVQQIHDAGLRAASLTQQLLAFSRRQVLQPQVVNLNEAVQHAEKLLRRLIGEDIELTTVLAPELGHVKVDPGQFQQVLLNLAVNARDAMPLGGKLTIETADVELDEACAEAHPEVWPGRYVLLALTDTGTGMDQATRARIFEPFFTTKEVGKGTGLGLAMVHGILKQSCGHVAVYSEPGHGTTFKLYLPVVEGRHAARSSDPNLLSVPTGAETILLVEDEEPVRRLARTTLQRSGYTVLEACHGGDAVRLAHGYPGPIHLLLSDVVMPEMGGRLLFERLAATRPSLKVLFVSGYTDDAVVRHGVLQAGVAFLQKPFSPAALARKVREVLDDTANDAALGNSAAGGCLEAVGTR